MKINKKFLSRLSFVLIFGLTSMLYGQTFMPTNVFTVTGASNLTDLDVGNLQTGTSNKEIVIANSGNYNNINANNFLPMISLTGMTLSQTNIPYNGYNANSVAVGDFNSDGYLDITHSSDCNCSNAYIRQGNAGGTFTSATVTSAFFMQRFTNDIAVGNILNDGRTSIASGGNALTEIKTNTGVGTAFTFTNVGTSSLNVNNPANSSWGFKIGDINGDGLGDVIAAYPTVGSVFIYYNTGSTPYFNTTNIQTINMTNNGVWDNVMGVATGDVDADGDLDIAAVVRTDGSGGRAFYVITNNGGGSFSVSSPVTIASFCTWIEMGDLNGDGRADIVIPGGNTVKVYNSTNGTFNSVANYTYNFGAKRVAISDLNGDGMQDIAAISSNQVVALIQGTTFVAANPNSFSSFSGCLGAPSANQTTTVYGGGLSSSITVTASAGYQISTNASTGFTTSLTIPQVGGVANNTIIYVRLNSATLGAVNGNLTVSASGATTVTIPLSGSVNGSPTVGAGSNQTVCNGTLVTLSGSGAASYTWNNGIQDGVPFAANTTQTYTVTGTDVNGCQGTAQVTVTAAGPNVSGGGNQAVCVGSSITLTGSGAVSYVWDNGVQNGVAFIPNATQTYTVTGTDVNGCTSTVQVVLTVNALPTVSAGSAQTVCAGASVTLSGSGASSYTWDNSVQNGVAFNASTTNTYTVTGTDANGCQNTAQVTVTANALPTVNAGSNQSVCPGTQVTLNGSGAVSYSWDNGIQDGVAFTANTTQTYTVTGTAANGCTNSAQVTVTAIIPNVSGGGNQGVCVGSSITLTGSGAVSYVWDNGVQNGVAFIPNANQTYTVTGTDANGCTGTAQVVLTVNALPTVSAGSAQTVCAGSPVTLSGSGASTYTWDNNVQNGVAFNASTTTTYTVTGTDANGCVNTAQVTVTVNALPTVGAGSNQTVCAGTSVTLTGTGASTYVWNNNVQNATSFIPNATQTYTVTGTDANGCVNTAQVTVTVNALPTVAAGSNQAVCAGTSVTLTGSGASTYAWNNSVQDGVAFIPNATQTYTVTGTDANGCVNTAQVTVTVNALPTVVTGSNQAVCAGTSVTLTGSGASTYAWNNSVQDGVAFIPNATQTYTVTGTDANGCVNTAQVTVTVNALPTVAAGSNQAVCAGTSVTLTGSGASTYAWNNNVSNGVAFIPNANQTYTVTGTDANGCTGTAQVVLTVNALPTVSAGSAQTVCAGSPVNLSGSGASTYTWDNNVQNGVAFNASTTTTYTVTGTDANGCVNTAQVTVTVNALPTVAAGSNQAVCAGTSVTLTGSGASTYVWNNNVQNATSFIPNATQTYTVTGTDANGCVNAAQVTVTVNALPTVAAGSNQAVCAGTSVTLTGSGASTYAWNNSVQDGVAFIPNATQTYTVTGTDANGCVNTAQVTVTVNALPTVAAGSNQAVCAGTSVTLTGSGASTYAWNNSVQDGVAFIPNATQTYTVTGTDANSCTNTAQVTVTVNALPNVSGGQNQGVCIGSPVTLSGSGASIYSWNNNVQNGVAFIPNATQTYTVTGTDVNGCVNTAQVTVTVNALPTVSANYPLSVCQGMPVVLIGSGALTYTWNNGVQNGIAFTPSNTQSYTVTGTDINGCTDSDQIAVTVNGYPTVNAGSNQTVCLGSSITLTATGASSYTWSNNVQNGVAFTVNATQTYTVIGSNSGCNDTAQVTVTVNSLPIVSAGQNQTVCAGTSVTLTGSGASTYAWNNNVSNGAAFIPNVTQSYTVTGTDANGCTNTAQVTVAVNALPLVNAGANQAICNGASAVLSATGAASYSWDNNVTNGISFIPNATQTYTVIGTDINGCQGTDQITITIVNSSSSALSEVACNQFTLNGQTYTQSGIYTQVVPNVLGCDSVITLNLTINNGPAVPVISVSTENVMTVSPQVNATYQWVFCNSGLSIANATDTIYSPSVNGIYAVEVSNGCGTSTSNCITIDNVGVDELVHSVAVYPNPTRGLLTVAGLPAAASHYEIHDLTGRSVLSGIFTEVEEQISLESLNTGQYFLIIEGNKISSIIKQ